MGVLVVVLAAGLAHGAPRARESAPTYAPKGQANGESGKGSGAGRPISEVAREILRRSTEIRREVGPVKSLRVAGCLCCHTSLEGISVGTFVDHIEHRQLVDKSRDTRAVGDREVSAAGPVEPGTLSGADELKRAIEASGESIRPAGSMASELAREQWDAERKRLEAEVSASEEQKSDWERALIYIDKGDFARALPFVKAHVGAQADAESRAAIAAAKAAAEAAVAKRPVDGTGVVESKAEGVDTGVPEVASPPLEETKRLLAFVLLKAGQADTASAVIREMYREDPRLARRPCGYAAMRVGDRHLHEAFAASVGFANRAKTGSGWLQAAVLAQAQGRLDLARTLIDRAAAAGLSKDIADTFAVAIDEALAADKAERAGKGKVIPVEPPKESPETPVGAVEPPAPKH